MLKSILFFINQRAVKVSGCILLSVLLNACGGGGGGGGSESSSSAIIEDIVTPTGTDAQETLSDDLEIALTENNFVNNGSGITIAVIDTGIATSVLTGVSFSTNSVSLANDISNENSTYANATQTIDDEAGHGTQVTSLIVSAVTANETDGSDSDRTVGLAINATILGIGLIDNTNQAEIGDNKINGALPDRVDVAMEYANDYGTDKTVINLSLGSPGTGAADSTCVTQDNLICMSEDEYEAYLKAIANGRLIVQAAGNDGDLNPTFAAQLVSYPDITKGQMLAVGALNWDGSDIASFSNRAGNSKNYFILAPGEEVNTIDENGTQSSTGNGTSFAAPIVSAAAAMVWSEWDHLNASQVVQVLLDTADDMGAVGVDEIYGYGKLNLANALTSQGTKVVSTGSSVDGSSIVLDESAMSGLTYSSVLSVLKNSNALKNAIYLDQYTRDFAVDLTAYIAEDSNDNLLSRWQYDTTSNQQAMNAFNLGNFSFTARPFSQGMSADDWQTHSFNVGYQFADGLSFALDNGTLFSHKLLANNQLAHRLLNDELSGQSSYIDLALNDNSAFYLGYAGLNEDDVSQYYFYGGQWQLTDDNHIGFGSMRVNESENQFLNITAEGTFALDKAYYADYYNVYFNHKLSNHHKLVFNYLHGYSQSIEGEGIIDNISALEMSGAEAMLTIHDDDYQLMLGLEKPLAITKGHIDVNVPSAVDTQGNVIYSSERLSLREDKPLNFISRYQLNVDNHNIDLTAAVNKVDEHAVSFRYQLAF